MDGANMNAQVGLCRPGRYRRGRLPSQSAQNFLHSPRRRRAGHGPDRGRQSSSSRFCPAIRCAANIAGGSGVGRGIWQRQHPHDSVGVHRADGRRRADPRHAGRDSQCQLHGQASRSALSRSSSRARTAAWPTSSSSTSRQFEQSARRQGRRHRQAADGLWLPRPHHELAGPRHADDRADRERIEGRAGSLLRCDDRDPRGDPRHRSRERPTGRTMC